MWGGRRGISLTQTNAHTKKEEKEKKKEVDMPAVILDKMSVQVISTVSFVSAGQCRSVQVISTVSFVKT